MGVSHVRQKIHKENSKKYKDRSINDLLSVERTKVLKLMYEHLEKGVINLFVRNDSGSVSAQTIRFQIF